MDASTSALHNKIYSFQYVENTVEDVIDQVLLLRKYDILERHVDGLVLTLKNLAEPDAIYIIIDSLLRGALNVDLHDTVALLKILSRVLSKTTTVKNKHNIRSHLKLRLRELVTKSPVRN